MEYFGAATAAYNAKLVKREQVNRILDRIKRVSKEGGSKLGGSGTLSDFTEHMLTELSISCSQLTVYLVMSWKEVPILTEQLPFIT